MINRRQWLYGVGVMAGAAVRPGDGFGKNNQETQKTPHRSLDLQDFEPKSMLQVQESRIERAKFPVLDFHTHIATSARSENGVELASERKYLGAPEELLAVMDRKNIRAMVNLTGGYDQGLVEVINKYDRAFPGRFYTFTEPCYERWKDPAYPVLQAQGIEQFDVVESHVFYVADLVEAAAPAETGMGGYQHVKVFRPGLVEGKPAKGLAQGAVQIDERGPFPAVPEDRGSAVDVDGL